MTTTNRYELFTRQCQDLAETVVIKDDITADRINEYLRLYQSVQVDANDKTTWKYYMNHAGVYHSTDERMYVTSADTLQTIEFNRANLQAHIATAEQFYYNSRAYKELLVRYPTQERLILGILYPVEMTDAIAAKDKTVIGWPAYLVESNEYSLMHNVSEWVSRVFNRWDNVQYNITDELYKAANLGVLSINLYPQIESLRLAACKTNEAHSFHVFHYLASHGFDQAFYEFLTLEQRLYFYRNIAYIEHNSGSSEVFAMLVEKVMTNRKLPVSDFTMIHDLTDMRDDGIKSLTPTIAFTRRALNMPTQQLGPQRRTLDDLLVREDNLAKDNPRARLQDRDVIESVMVDSRSNLLDTKVVESYVVDYSNASIYPFLWVTLNHWIALAKAGKILSYTQVTNPKNGERIVLNAMESVWAYLYAFHKAQGLDIATPPLFMSSRVSRDPQPTLAQVREKIDAQRVSDATITSLLIAQPLVEVFTTSEQVYQYCRRVWLNQESQTRLITYQNGFSQRAQLKNAVAQLYADTLIDLSAGFTGTYEDFFAARNVNVSSFTTDDFQVLYLDILNNATGLSRHKEVTVRDVQRAMLSVMKQLSSYSVQFISDIVDADMVLSDHGSYRLEDLTHENTGTSFGVTMGINVTGIAPESEGDVEVRVSSMVGDSLSVNFGVGTLPVTVDCSLVDGLYFTERNVSLSSMGFSPEFTPSSDPDVMSLPGAEEGFNQATAEQRAMMYTAYNNRRFYDDQLYTIFLARNRFNNVIQNNIPTRINTDLKPDLTIAKSNAMKCFKVRLGLTVPFGYVTAYTVSEIPAPAAAMFYGPFEDGVYTPNLPDTLNVPSLNDLTITLQDIASAYGLLLS